jgi:hypothetical protein
MSIDKDSVGIDEGPPVERPPAISERLWNLIAPEDRKAWRIEAAMGLRKGVHPETTVIAMLVAKGWDPEHIAASITPTVYYRDEHDSYDDFDEFSTSEGPSAPLSPAAAPAADPAPAVNGPKGSRAPVWPYGTEGYKRPWEPIGEIGGILHYDSGFDGATAAEMEWQIHKAIARDPAFVRKDPSNIALLGCTLPSDVMPSIRSSVLFECGCVIEDIRRRRDAGDLSAMVWIDPDEFVL